MKLQKTLTFAVTVTVAVVMTAGLCLAQSSDQKTPPPILTAVDSKQKVPATPCLYCIQPEDPVLQKWSRYNRALTRDALRRSDLNPESSLDYMMRTF